MCVCCRSYGVPEAQVHENPEWEKARQALASINKSQSPAKMEQVSQVLTHDGVHQRGPFVGKMPGVGWTNREKLQNYGVTW